MRSRAVLLIAVMAAALLLAGGTALAVNKVCPSSGFCDGTSGNDLLIGTDDGTILSSSAGNDQLIGNGGDDILNGGAGSDTYSFRDNFGANDTLEDTAGSTTDRDTVDFSKVTSEMTIGAIPEWASKDPRYTKATGAAGTVNFSSGTTIEKIVSSAGSDSIDGGKENNTYVLNGSSVSVNDRGGTSVSPALPASNDTYIYKSGSASITDEGGSGDVLDLRPLKVTDVSFKADFGDLVIYVGPTSSIGIEQQLCQTKFRIEKLVFADRTITSIGNPNCT